MCSHTRMLRVHGFRGLLGVTVNAPYRYSVRTVVGLQARILRTLGARKWERQIGDYKGNV